MVLELVSDIEKRVHSSREDVVSSSQRKNLLVILDFILLAELCDI